MKEWQRQSGLWSRVKYMSFMKRFKECNIKCFPGQRIDELVQLVINESRNNGYEVERSSTLDYNDTLIVTYNQCAYPYRVILSVLFQESMLKITNIIPSSYCSLHSFNYDQYNSLLDEFVHKVLHSLSSRYHNPIDITSDTFFIWDVIPLSYTYLDRWLNAFPLSGHSCDENRWFDFLIALLENHETLGSDILSKYIEERYAWDKVKLNALEERYDEQLRLLEYYVNRRES